MRELGDVCESESVLVFGQRFIWGVESGVERPRVSSANVSE